MKKESSLVFLLSIVLLLALFTGTALSASATATATLSVANVQAHPGETVVVDISLNGDAAGMQIILNYNPAVLTPEKIEQGPQLPYGWTVISSNDLTKGRIAAVSGSSINETVNGIIARYTYKVNPTAPLGKSSLNVVTAIMADAIASLNVVDFNATVASQGSVTVVSSNEDLSDDATLSELKINDGTITLVPAFNSNQTAYTATVGNSVTGITVTAVANQAAATVVGAGEKSLSVGENEITITVTAENGVTKEYIITVTREGSGSGNQGNQNISGSSSGSGVEDIESIASPLSTLFPFTDVTESDWFYNDVYYMWDNGLMNGTSATLFSPYSALTRGMVVTVLYRMEQEPDIAGLENPFNDVVTEKYYKNAVIWAADKKLVLGYGDGTYRPDRNVTREEFAAILYRYEQYTEKIPLNIVEEKTFADANTISDYAKESVNALVMQGIINGKENNRFDPKSNATRAEFAAMLHRYIVAISDQ